MFGLPVVFNGGGGLYSYMLGITAELQQCHDLSGTRFLTASGSSVSGLLLAAGIDAERFHLDCNRNMLEDCRAHATGFLSNIRIFVLAVLAQSSGQKGVLWWAAHHRTHHKRSDTERDVHSPVQYGFWRAHMGWFLDP